MGCYLRILGDFNPEELLSDCRVNLKPERLWKKGDAVGPTQRFCEVSGIQFVVSQAPREDYRRLFGQASFFLSANKEWVRSLAMDSRVEEAFLDFGLSQDLHPAYYRRLPLNLIQWSGVCRVEIELSFYAISEKGGGVGSHPNTQIPSGIAGHGEGERSDEHGCFPD